MRIGLLACIAGCAFGSSAFAQTIDGTLDGVYGGALAVQTIETGFGDNASEWNAAYATIAGGRLNIMFTGNLENNFNKLEIFIDANGGGSNVLTTEGNDGSGIMNGMTFDTDFTPETHMIAHRGASKFDLDFASLGGGGFNFYEDVFGGTDAGFGTTGTGVNASGIDVGYDGSNTAGIGGTAGNAADQAAAQAVTTGLELSIDLADLGYSGSGPIRIMLLQNNDNHDFVSNQSLGGLPVGFGNLGSPSAGLDFSSYDGNQYFTIPAPGAVALLGLAGLGMTRRRR